MNKEIHPRLPIDWRRHFEVPFRVVAAVVVILAAGVVVAAAAAVF